MPKKSFREKLTDALIDEAAEEIIDIEDDDAVDAVLDELADNISVIMECWRGDYSIIPKSDIWRNNILTTLDEGRSRQMLRIDRDRYNILVDLIKNDEEFNKAHSCKQFSVELQLAVTLFRLGSSGESAAFRKIATIFGVGDGKTISLITKRIFKVFLRHQSKYTY
ncbi:PREDICTED: uncharacterized protein LOC108971293 [Bactrocera latifrons]|nr:PREDICTED: uncharacterized protein LOC108971293 [Bactrocera latifrons]